MYYGNETDEILVMLTLAGEQAAYESLVARYQRAVISSAAAVTKNHFMAEDAAQDAFVTAWMKLNTLKEPQKYAAWVCRIAKNCALNMISRYRGFLPLDVVDNLAAADDRESDPAVRYVLSEEQDEVNESIRALPERVRQIIYLHYFEDLSIAEIADRMRISEGTVKWQLHDGRKRIRKGLCAMNEKYNDTLVERVMKKVEELKLWQLKNDKSGFAVVYRDVLREVEELPESREKQHALADVLMRGWWWIPGEKNDALFARIAASAMEGKNEEVMSFIVAREDSRVYGGARIEFIRDKQIPRLTEAGFVKALGREWFWLGYHLFRQGKTEEANAAYDKVEEILDRDDLYRVLVPYARRMEEKLCGDFRELSDERYLIGGNAEEYRFIDGKLRRWAGEGFGEGWLNSVDREVMQIFLNSSACDGSFFADILPGEQVVGSDGTTLAYVSAQETVETPAGRFEGCQLWVTTHWNYNGKSVFKSYYKAGVGIVRHEHASGGISEARVLKSYQVKTAEGLLPLDEGNTWVYASAHDPDTVCTELVFTVSFVNPEKVILSSWSSVKRLQYDENDWLEMIGKIRCDYVAEKDGTEHLCDVYPAIARAEQLAVTPMEKAHTKAAASVARRILSTDPGFNPDCTATGHWNFFSKNAVQKKKDSVCISHNTRWSFEWKNTGGMGSAEDPILYNDILGILQDAANCIWSDEWQIGASPIVEYNRYERNIRTQITCEDGGTVTTKAGTFENCIRLTLDIDGMDGGLSYRGDRKVYYFADGIGIVRTENAYCSGAKTAVYELTAYAGVGEGFMPLADGLVRRYDAQNLTDGFVGAVEYTYVADEDGEMIIFADRTGIRELTLPITQYSAIEGEVLEQKLFDEGKWKEGHMKYAANNFHLILHMLARPGRHRHNTKRSAEITGFYLKMMDQLGEKGEVPPAWYGLYAWTALVRAAALFGAKRADEGYASLELALNCCEKNAEFKRGDLLDIGSESLFGGAKYVYGKGCILLADGTKEALADDFRMNFGAKNIVSALTTPYGWEWFNSVRAEERFMACIERAKALAGG